MNSYFSIINSRTILTLFISTLVPYLCYQFDIVFNIDLTLISIAIIFPLVFAIRGAFRRREKSLEFLVRFRSALKTIEYSFATNKGFSEEKKEELFNILKEINEKLFIHLKENSIPMSEVDASINKITLFLNQYKEDIPNRLHFKVLGFIRSLLEGAENLEAVHTHRTPISLKAYCKVFIYIFPVIYAPTIIYKIGVTNQEFGSELAQIEARWLTYFVVIVTEFILISLYNIQDQLEYPFDDDGLDDINLNSFHIER